MANHQFDTAHVEAFMESFYVPGGVEWADFMRDLGDYLNKGDDGSEPDRIVLIGEKSGWSIRGAVWQPPTTGPHPVVLHIHGGGWVSGSHLSHRLFDAELSRAGYVVVAVDYRRAPKHRFPAAFDDCIDALRWVHDNVEGLGGDPTGIAMLGDSAGANLVAGVLAADTHEVPVAAAVLLFGIYDYHRALPVVGRMSGGTDRDTQPYLSVDEFEKLRADPRVNPILSTNPWPPLLLASGTRDPLVEETRRLHDKLLAAGVEHSYQEIGGAPHSYIQLRSHRAYAEGFATISGFLDRNVRQRSDA